MPPKATKPSRQPTALPADDDALVRLPTVLSVFPVGENTWWVGIKAGRYPAPVKLGPRISAWRVGAIRRLLASVAETVVLIIASVVVVGRLLT